MPYWHGTLECVVAYMSKFLSGRKFTNMNITNFLYLVSGIIISILFFIAPIPGFSVPRNVLLIGLILSCAFVYRITISASPINPKIHLNAEIIVFFILSMWMILQSSLWAIDPTASLSDLTEEWIGSILLAALGYLTVRQISSVNRYVYILIGSIVFALFAHAACVLMFQVSDFLQTGIYKLGSTPYADYSYLSTPINMAIALLVAGIVSQWLGDNKLFPWRYRITLTLLALSSIAALAIKARNGIISIFVILFVAGLLISARSSKRSKSYIHFFTLILVATGLLSITFHTDSRWHSFVETVPVAWDIESHKAWLDKEKYPIPTLPSGSAVDLSAYDRISWIRVALEGIASHPIGFGYGTPAFGRYINSQYHMDGFVSSHSGLLDFTLANGLPGLFLLLLFFFFLFKRGWKAWIGGNPFGLALILILTNYFVRICLDGHFGSFRLNMTAFLLGILYYLSTCEQSSLMDPSTPRKA